MIYAEDLDFYPAPAIGTIITDENKTFYIFITDCNNVLITYYYWWVADQEAYTGKVYTDEFWKYSHIIVSESEVPEHIVQEFKLAQIKRILEK